MRTLTKLLLYESMSHMNSSTTDKWFTRSIKFDENFWKSIQKSTEDENEIDFYIENFQPP